MKKYYTQQEIDEMRLAFEGPHGIGLINEIVFSEYRKNKVFDVDYQTLIEFFSSFNCSGVVSLIKTFQLFDGSGAYEFGSHSIDLYGVTDGPFSFENARTLICLKIGNIKMGITPSQWMSYLSRGFEQLSQLQMVGFDDVCDDFAKINQAVASGEGEVIEPEVFFGF